MDFSRREFSLRCTQYTSRHVQLAFTRFADGELDLTESANCWNFYFGFAYQRRRGKMNNVCCVS